MGMAGSFKSLELTPVTHLFQQGQTSKSFPSTSSWDQVSKYETPMGGVMGKIELQSMKKFNKNYFYTFISDFYLRLTFIYEYVYLYECMPQCIGAVRSEEGSGLTGFT